MWFYLPPKKSFNGHQIYQVKRYLKVKQVTVPWKQNPKIGIPVISYHPPSFTETKSRKFSKILFWNVNGRHLRKQNPLENFDLDFVSRNDGEWYPQYIYIYISTIMNFDSVKDVRWRSRTLAYAQLWPWIFFLMSSHICRNQTVLEHVTGQFGNVHATIKPMKKYPKGIFEFFSSETPRLQLNRSHVHISKFKYSHGTFFNSTYV